MDELEKDILSLLGSGKRMISDIEESGLAARQTLHTRIEGLVARGYLQVEREEKLPFRRYLSLTRRGQDELELELSKVRIELVERAGGEKDLYRTSWFFRDFVHNDLSPRESVLKGALRLVGTVGTLPVYQEILQPAFKPSGDERDYGELLMRLLVDSVDYEGIFRSDQRLKGFVGLYPAYKRTIATGLWGLATAPKGDNFDYLSAFDGVEVRRLTRRPFVEKLRRNYAKLLDEECSRTVGGPVQLDEDEFLKVLCWMRLKMRSLPFRAYDKLRGPLLKSVRSSLGLVN